MRTVRQVLADLQKHRRGSAAFAGKEGFITLRDLFRYKQNERGTATIFKEINFLFFLSWFSVCLDPQNIFSFWTLVMKKSVLSLHLNLRDKG
jgi:hypothetical protein